MLPVADLLRLIAVVLSVTAGAAILSVIRLHWMAWRSVRQAAGSVWPDAKAALRKGQFREAAQLAIETVAGSPGLTPFHVWAVSVAHGMLLFAISMGMIDTLGSPPTWRIGIYIAAPALTLIALWAIGLAQHRRVNVRVNQVVTTEVI